MTPIQVLFSVRSSEVVVEALECVSNKWKAHLGCLLLIECLHSLSLLSLQQRSIVCLVDLVGREISGIDVAGQARLERRPNSSQ